MLRQHSILHALIGKYWTPALVAAALLMVGNVAAWAGDNRSVALIETITVPVTGVNNTAGGLYSFDIAWVDQGMQTYYLADRSNVRVDILDAANPGTVKQINATPSFAGFTGTTATSGPNGVATSGQCLFVTDAPSRVVSFTQSTLTQVSDIKTDPTEPTRADELAWGAGLLLVINNAATPPFGTWIHVNPATCQLTVGGRITLDKAHGVDAQNGAEQPVWEPLSGSFYLSVPQIGGTVSHGGVVRIAPNATTVNPASFPVGDIFGIDFCSPAGLTVGPGRNLFVGCNMVFDQNGNVWDPNGAVTAAPQDVILNTATGNTAGVLGVGAGDEVWFNGGDGNYYATGSGSPFRPLPATAAGSTPLGVVDSVEGAVLQLVTTYNVPAVTTGPMSGQHPAGTAHSVAANGANNLIFVALAANNAFPSCLHGCIAVFGHSNDAD